MKMVSVSKDALRRKNKNYKPGKVQRIVSEFIASNKDVVEIQYEEDEYSAPYSCTGALTTAIKSMKVASSIKAVTIDGQCYLYRKDKIDD